jgi:hypothetical protein
MRRMKIFPGMLPILLAACLPAGAQLSPSQPDPLARIREAAQGNTQACSATGESLCEQVAPKIIANAQGDSPLAENLHSLAQKIAEGKSDGQANAVSWAVAAFQAAGIDVHTEKDVVPSTARVQEIVVGEIRGREKPDEWVLLGAHLDSWTPPPGAVNDNCDASMVIEAARDILRTGVRPLRSIRFVLFTGQAQGNPGTWAYVRAHRAELDRARAAIISRSTCLRVTGYSLNGRRDIESGLREAMKPIESLGAGHYFFGAFVGTDDFDFLAEGVPTLTAINVQTSYVIDFFPPLGTPDKIDIADLKRNTAIAAVTAFGIAEHAEPIGSRQSRKEIESLLKTFDLDQQMKTMGRWSLWESGERGRLP